MPQKKAGRSLAKDELIAKRRAHLVLAGAATWRVLFGGTNRVEVFITVFLPLMDSMSSMSGSKFFIFGSYTVPRSSATGLRRAWSRLAVERVVWIDGEGSASGRVRYALRMANLGARHDHGGRRRAASSGEAFLEFLAVVERPQLRPVGAEDVGESPRRCSGSR